jgi:hypothetical protein
MFFVNFLSTSIIVISPGRSCKLLHGSQMSFAISELLHAAKSSEKLFRGFIEAVSFANEKMRMVTVFCALFYLFERVLVCVLR